MSKDDKYKRKYEVHEVAPKGVKKFDDWSTHFSKILAAKIGEKLLSEGHIKVTHENSGGEFPQNVLVARLCFVPEQNFEQKIEDDWNDRLTYATTE